MPRKPFRIMHRKPTHVLNTPVLPLDIKDDGFGIVSAAAILYATLKKTAGLAWLAMQPY